ncbi:3-oxoacyl-ACP synthase III family protein [Mariniblastus fucicola]|uniref:3-oxoacyl-[acyl-carrier-protein] synthase 3 n=1 Tax=Mariniblastus fucicola TaxID=980251 RepID=A0A5B9PCZ8_9BACT|nr:ketoacyl-ACP synthase III [Mariniblastus fucicola]QEG22950.1 3-oxoacyl-[acyl-carrier-protein] synthase 3 [Mariniblastus fucicola]
MSKLTHHFQISAAHFAVPPDFQTAEELAKDLDCEASWIHENVGVSNRHVCQPGDDPAKLAATAARPAIENLGTPDLLIYSSATVRQCIPDTSVFVARELGISGVPTYSVNATCLSFLVALRHAAAMISDKSYSKILIVTAELPTLSRNFSDPKSAALLGDGAAAVMVESTTRDAGAFCFRQKTWPEFAELTQIRGGGLLNHPMLSSTKDTDYLFEMSGEVLLRAAIPKLKRFLSTLLSDAELSVKDLDLIVPHQASAAGMRLLERLGLPKNRTVDILGDYGNCVSASMPMALAIAQRDGRIKPGDKILFLGTAAGLSIGATVLQW